MAVLLGSFYFLLYFSDVFILATKDSRNLAGKWVYERYLQSLSNYLRFVVNPALTFAFSEGTNEEFLSCWVKEWIRYKMLCVTLNACFRYLDKFLVWKRFLPCLEEASFNVFKNVIFKAWRERLHKTVAQHLVEEISKQSAAFSLDDQLNRTRSGMLNFLENSLDELDEKTSNLYTRGRLTTACKQETGSRIALELSFELVCWRSGMRSTLPVELSTLILEYARDCADPVFTIPLDSPVFRLGRSLTVRYAEGRIFCSILGVSLDAVQVRAQYDSGFDDIVWLSKFSPRIIVE
eukprot:TRINITY_DN4969_c0_g2_i1.p1 TRINITY_DN4969_c0_g2~~TRINITY_DN4969_c0_g2_i1.p1  ORF type:complete len:293 (-),score=56.18 TRINITY_DN4969_c0_g2_i1:16-894(-)